MLHLDNPIISPQFIGREREAELLIQALHTSAQGTGQSVLVAGEAGVGKSRLLAELRNRADDQGFLVLQGHCFESDLTFPHAPMIDALRHFFALLTPAEVAGALGPLAPELVKLLPELSLTVPEAHPTPTLDPEAEKRRLFESLTQFLTRLTVSQPVLLIFEDIHWSDEVSLDYLHFFARRLPPLPILLVASYRHEDKTSTLNHTLVQLQRQRLVQEINLNRLSQGETDAMLRAIFELKRPTRAEFLHTIFMLTDGNPFFIEEVLKSLIAAGDIFFARGRWDRKPLKQLRIPPTVLTAVQQRTDGLSEVARQLLTLAAVAGQRFDFDLLQALTNHSEANLLVLLKELLTAQLIVEETADHFRFQHALTRHAVFTELMARERRVLHQTIAETLERIHADAVEMPLSNLAYHFFEAEAWEQALRYAHLAGERARALHAPYAALDQFSRAITAVSQLNRPPSPALHHARGQIYELLGDFESALADYEQAIAAARAVPDAWAEWQNLMALGFLWSSRDYKQAGGFLQQALELARTLDEPAAVAHSLNRAGNWHLNTDRALEAQRCHLEALAIFQAANDRHGLATTWDLLGTTSLLSGDTLAAVRHYRQAIALFRELDDHRGLVSSLAMYSICSASYLSDTMVCPTTSLGECIGYGEEALQLARQIGWRSGEANALLFCGFSLGGYGEYTLALEHAQAGLNLAIEIENNGWLFVAQMLFGALYLDLLALPAARQHLEQGLELAIELNSSEDIKTVTGFLASTYIAQGELERAQAVLDPVRLNLDASATMAGLTKNPDQGSIQSEALRSVWYRYGELALARQEPGQALKITDRLLASAANTGAGGVIPRLWQLRGEALIGLNRLGEAEEILRAAQTTAESQGLRPFLWRLHVMIGRLYLVAKQRAEAEQEFAAARTIIKELADKLTDSALRDNFQKQALHAIPSLPPLSKLQATKQKFGGLTRREREVAVQVAAGKSNLEIAETLVIGERTVETHVSNILSKLDFSARTQIAAWVVEVGLTQN